jgi:hypothetical protein
MAVRLSCALVSVVTPLLGRQTSSDIHSQGNHTDSSNIWFNQGSQDPWQRAGVQYTLSYTEPAHYTQCMNCGRLCFVSVSHFVLLRSLPPLSPLSSPPLLCCFVSLRVEADDAV